MAPNYDPNADRPCSLCGSANHGTGAHKKLEELYREADDLKHRGRTPDVMRLVGFGTAVELVSMDQPGALVYRSFRTDEGWVRTLEWQGEGPS